MVNRNCLRWKPIQCLSINGNLVFAPFPEAIAIRYRGRLPSEILSMPKKNPISFADAVNTVVEAQKKAFSEDRMGRNPGQYSWYTENFVQFISDLGFHIELTGDEFEPYVMTDKLG